MVPCLVPQTTLQFSFCNFFKEISQAGQKTVILEMIRHFQPAQNISLEKKLQSAEMIVG